MTVIKVLTIIFIAFASSRAMLRFRERTISSSSAVFWLLIWAATLILVLNPKISDKIAGFLGLSRGIDTIFFLALILIFYLTFRLYVKIDSVDKELTDLSVNISKLLHNKKEKS